MPHRVYCPRDLNKIANRQKWDFRREFIGACLLIPALLALCYYAPSIIGAALGVG